MAQQFTLESNYWQKRQEKGFSTRKVMSSKLGRSLLVFAAFATLLWTIFQIPNVTKVSSQFELNNENSKLGGGANAACPSRVLGSLRDRQHIIVIDAGSQGSRVHVYEYDYCNGPEPVMLGEVFKETQPGLSSYDKDAEKAASSIKILLDEAMKAIPREYRSCSPITVKATAGLRKLSGNQADNILAAIYKYIQENYPFPIAKNGIEIMDGTDEGVYSWITVNYLLSLNRQNRPSSTVAVLDLGGASTQIVFEPTFTQNNKMIEGEHHYILKYGGREVSLYQYSHLNYGLMVARDMINQLIVGSLVSALDKPISMQNPCLSAGSVAQLELKEAVANGHQGFFIMNGPSTEQVDQCLKFTKMILNKEADCKQPSCSFNGIYQPSMSLTFSKEPIYIFSYFYDRIFPLLNKSHFKIKDIKALARKVCAGEESWKNNFNLDQKTLLDLKLDPQWCLDLNYMYTILSVGYDLDDERIVNTVKKIEGKEIGWCLGVSLPMLIGSSDWECRLEEVH